MDDDLKKYFKKHKKATKFVNRTRHYNQDLYNKLINKYDNFASKYGKNAIYSNLLKKYNNFLGSDFYKEIQKEYPNFVKARDNLINVRNSLFEKIEDSNSSFKQGFSNKYNKFKQQNTKNILDFFKDKDPNSFSNQYVNKKNLLHDFNRTKRIGKKIAKKSKSLVRDFKDSKSDDFFGFNRPVDKDNPRVWGYATKAERESASALKHFSRAFITGTGGSGYKREAAYNTLGFLTKKQKMDEVLTGGFMTKVTNLSVPISTLMGVNVLLDEDPNATITDYIYDFGFAEVGMMTGGAIGKELGYTFAKMTGLGVSGKKLLAQGIFGGLAGGAVGYLGGLGIGYLFKESVNSDNEIIRYAHELGLERSQFVNNDYQTQGTLTNRQKVLAQAGRSVLNDRNELLGNEANVIRGIY